MNRAGSVTANAKPPIRNIEEILNNKRKEFELNKDAILSLNYNTKNKLVKKEDLILKPLMLWIWNSFPKPIWYSVNVFNTTLKSLRIWIVVIFEVTDSWLSSIVFRNLLYLNLAPNLFNSVEFEYLSTLLDMIDDIALVDFAKLVL